NFINDDSNGMWGTKPVIRLSVGAISAPSEVGLACNTISYPIQGNAGQVGQNWKNGGFFTDPIYFWGNSGGPWNLPTALDSSDSTAAKHGSPALVPSVFFQGGRDEINSSLQGGRAKPGYTAYTYPPPLLRGTQPPVPPAAGGSGGSGGTAGSGGSGG